MQLTNFNNYRTAFKKILSRFDEAIHNIQESDNQEETYELQNIKRLRTNLNVAAPQSDGEICKRKEKDYTEEDIGDCINRLKSIAISGKQEKKLTEQSELVRKLNILDKAVFLKHFTSSVMTEVNNQLIGVMLNKASGKAEIKYVQWGDKTGEDLLKQILIGTPID